MAQKSSSDNDQSQKKASGSFNSSTSNEKPKPTTDKKDGGSKFRNGKTIDSHYKLRPKTTPAVATVEAKTSSSNKNGVKKSGSILLNIMVALTALALGVVFPPQRIMTIIKSINSEAPLQQTDQRKLNTGDQVSSDDSFKPIFECDDRALSNFLHKDAVPGMHVICFSPHGQGDSKGTLVTFFAGSMETHDTDEEFIKDSDWSWPSLKESLSKNLLLTAADDLHQPWAIFTPTGEKIILEDASEDSSVDIFKKVGMALVFKGGQWFWPGVEKGFIRTIKLDDEHNATLETLSLKPLVLSVKGFLTDDECTHIQDLAGPSMRYSEVTLMDHDAGRPASDFRTSQSTFLPAKTPTLKSIDERTASLVRMPKSHQEYAQVLRYGNNEKYDTHLDYFDPKMYKNDKRTLAMIQNGKVNRMATVFWYLTDVSEGGETVFPRVDGSAHPSSSLDCTVGLRVKPERGKVIIFYSMTPDGEMDEFSLHGACPVKEGVKWASNKWVWNWPMGYVRD